MSTTTILPDLQSAILCEDIRSELGGQQSLIGVISVIPTAILPIGFLKLCLWTRWCGGSGQFQQKAVIIDPNEEHQVASAEIDFILTDMQSHATNAHFFTGLQLQQYGIYHVEIYLQDHLQLRFPLPVLEIPQDMNALS